MQEIQGLRWTSVARADYLCKGILDPLEFVEVTLGSAVQKWVGIVKARTNQRDCNWFGHILREGGTDVAESSNVKITWFADGGHMGMEGEPAIHGHSQSSECIRGLDPSASHINRFVRWKCAATLMSA